MRISESISLFDYLDEAMDIVKNGNSVSVVVVGGSMMPLLRNGREKVVLRRMRQYERGDIILFTSRDGRYILHRILRVKNNQALTCGDGNTRADGWIPLENILCAAVKFERNGALHSLDAFPWKQFGWMWMALYPVRPFLLRAYRFAGRVRRKLRALFLRRRESP